jgi:hypothetical protein
MERLMGHRSPPSAQMARGKSVEHGVHAGLLDPARPTNECAAQAVKAFDREMALVADDRRDNEREAIPGYVACGLAELRQYGIPTAYQDRVELRLDDVPIPIMASSTGGSMITA